VFQERARRNGRRGAVEAGTSWNEAAPSVEAFKRSAAQRRGPGRVFLARGLAASIRRGEPAVSRSGGPCGPPERDAGARAEAGGVSRRDAPTRRVRSGGG